MAIVKLENVSKILNGSSVLSGVNLEVRRGETLVIIGRSGTGKSVTLKHIIGLMNPDSGAVSVFGEDLRSLSRAEILKMRLRIGYLFQGGALINWLTVADNVALPLREHRFALSEKQIQATVNEKLDVVELLPARSKFPEEISGGMKKRVGLARAIVMDPDLILYDEPTSGLDPVMAGVINRLVRHTQEVTHATQLVVTHDMESAYAIGDRIAMLHNGRIVAAGTPEEIRASSDPVVLQFIRGSPEGPITGTTETGQKERVGNDATP